MNGLKILKGFIIFLVLMVSIGGMFTAASAATLSTDKPDYAPGEVVIITGSGWMPGETVSIILHEESQLSEPDVTLLSVADANGNIFNGIWSPDAGDIGLAFTLTAIGQTSNLTAQTTFTDAVQIGTVCPNNSTEDDTCIINGVTGDCVHGCRKDNGDCFTNQAVFVAANTSCTDDGNQCTSDVCNGSGLCTHSAYADGTTCSDGNACTQNDTCQSGTCESGTPVVCSASDQCHVAGICDTATGVCSNPTAANGTTCSDGNACTENDTCQAGVCTAGTPLNCDDGNPCNADSCDAVSGCQHDGPLSCNAVTDSFLCPFDVDNGAKGNQFRLILTPDQSASIYKLNASNPGQFYYNVFDGSGTGTLTIEIPYPFVTQGAMPIHVYDQAPLNPDGCLLPGNEVTDCTVTTDGENLSPSGAPVILLDDYGTVDTITHAVVTCNVPSSGFLYVNVHLDYGLKGTKGYSNSNSNVLNASDLSLVIPNMANYAFGFTDGIPETYSDSVQSENVFKHDPGIGGLVLDSDGYPVENATVQIFLGTSQQPAATVLTDADGWYMWSYKWKGKAASFVISMTPPSPYVSTPQSQTVTLKANGFLNVPFTVPMP